MNWNLIAFIGLMAIFVVAFLVMLYFQWVDGYVRKWRWERAERKAQEQ
jgi:peptidoglycan biosynthesis protein MviN/MurJ (putative lipid II flippase)